jgi:putative transposase
MERIRLTEKEVEYLSAFVKKGRKSARELTRAHVLLLVSGGRTEMEITDTLGISRATVSNIKRRYREEGLQSALREKTRPGQPKKYTERHEAEIIAQACTRSPDGSKRWSLTLLTEEMRKKEGFETINRESIRLIFKKSKQNLG